MRSKKICLQQDNASPHLCVNSTNQKMIEKCKSLNIDVIPLFKLPNSPDLNILDLSFFNSLQSRQFRGTLGNCSATLVDTVIDTFLEYPWEVLDRAF
jgi:hypothetical protein